MKKLLLILVTMLLATTMAFAGGEDEDSSAMSDRDFSDNPYTDGADLSGTTVNIFGAFVDNDADRFRAAMVPFEEATGIEVVYEGSGDFETLITVRAEGGSPPDIAAFPQPGLAADLVRGGYVFDMADWLGMDYLSEQYSSAWTDLAEIEGIQAGVWYRASIKSLVWYNKIGL
jgi:alpha-glucoside transport system substrate-binding protein